MSGYQIIIWQVSELTVLHFVTIGKILHFESEMTLFWRIGKVYGASPEWPGLLEYSVCDVGYRP